jgi:hypothetical protein
MVGTAAENERNRHTKTSIPFNTKKEEEEEKEKKKIYWWSKKYTRK